MGRPIAMPCFFFSHREFMNQYWLNELCWFEIWKSTQLPRTIYSAHSVLPICSLAHTQTMCSILLKSAGSARANNLINGTIEWFFNFVRFFFSPLGKYSIFIITHLLPLLCYTSNCQTSFFFFFNSYLHLYFRTHTKNTPSIDYVFMRIFVVDVVFVYFEIENGAPISMWGSWKFMIRLAMAITQKFA